MTRKRIFITGASGCLGHYITERLINHSEHELFLLMRTPTKLQLNTEARSGIHVLQGDLGQIEQQTELLKTIDVAICIATAWGDPATTRLINVDKTLELMELLDPERVEQVIYFSTESILNRDNQLLPEAAEIGSDYIKTKSACFQALKHLAIAPKITTLFPTLVFGGDERKPYSHLTGGLSDVTRWIPLIRFFGIDASFHFVHGYDVGQVVAYLIENPPQDNAITETGDVRKMILGSDAVTVNQAISQISNYFGKHVYFRIPITQALAEFFIKVFRIEVGPWDRFCIRYRHFTHANPVSPSSFGLKTQGSTIRDIFQLSGVDPKKN